MPHIHKHEIELTEKPQATKTSDSMTKPAVVDKPLDPGFSRFLPGDPPRVRRKGLFQQFLSLLIMLVFNVGISLALYYGLRDTIGLL